MLAKYFNAMEELTSEGQELNRVIVAEIKAIKLSLNDVSESKAARLKRDIKELNKDRIRALGLKLVQGEKSF